MTTRALLRPNQLTANSLPGRDWPHPALASTRLQLAILSGGVLTSAAAAGWGISRGAALPVATVAAVPVVVSAIRRYPGVMLAVLLLAVLNGIPLVNLSGQLPGGLHLQDAAVIGLAALLYLLRAPARAERSRLEMVLELWSWLFIAYWIATTARSVLGAQIPLTKAVLYGRDFLYFPLLLRLALRAKLPAGAVRSGLWTLVAITSIDGFAQTVSTVGGPSLHWIIHPGLVDTSTGLNRIYSLMSDLINSMLILAGAFAVSAFARGRRRLPGLLACLLLAASVLELTRANYFALAVALVVGIYVATLRFASPGTAILRLFTLILIMAAAVLTVSSVTGPSGESGTASSPVTSILLRAEGGFTSLSNSSGTVGYRISLDHQMLTLLGGHWLLGLGFLHPAVHYVVGLPDGAIRNTDTGLFNALMTMGLIGVLLVYAPLLLVLRELLRIGRRVRRDSLPAVAVFGGAAWIAFAIAGSPTLVLLFGVSGLTLSAMILAGLALAARTPSA